MRIFENDFERICHAGIKNAELDFVFGFISSWLTEYPGDLLSKNFLAEISRMENDKEKSRKLLSEILEIDPENLLALEHLKNISTGIEKILSSSKIHVLTGEIVNIDELYPWAMTLRTARLCRQKGDFKNARKLLGTLTNEFPEQILIFLELTRVAIKEKEILNYSKLLQDGLHTWKNCLQFRLFETELLLNDGREVEAITNLHKCVSLDPGGVVVQREWGRNHEFNSLWPEIRYMEFEQQVPSSIAIPLGWKRIGSNLSYSPKSMQDTSSNQVNQKISINPDVSFQSLEEKRTYVILTTRSGLEKKYGTKTAAYILQEINQLKEEISRRENWTAMLLIPDDGNISSEFGLKPIESIDPWKIKLSLSDLNAHLKQRGSKVSALLIVGGHEIVPFHELSNPTDDSDTSVISDNPYGTEAGNYLIPEWTIGRFPDEKGGDPGLLLAQLRQAIQYHKSHGNRKNKIPAFLQVLIGRFKLNNIFRGIIKKSRNFGYSTAVWRRSSLAAFRPIGKGADLFVTPPFDKDTIDVDRLLNAKCAYVNLHGLASSPQWYGQRDFSEAREGPDFPVAIETSKIPNFRNNIDMVFTEACYGGFVNNKSIEESMALKLISIGSQGLVGSTCISYGSVFTPLIGADLLAFIFWKYLEEGYSFGESLSQAKIGVVKVMNQRQGYLDGEDQKTLMSFVLYGDPLAYLEQNFDMDKTAKAYENENLHFQTIADQDGAIVSKRETQAKIPIEVNEIIQAYIPSIHNSNVKMREYKVSVKKIFSDQNPNVPISNGMKKYTQIQYSQKIRQSKNTHEQFARVTLDSSGRLTKLAVSR